MGRIVRLTERDLTRLVRRVIREQEEDEISQSKNNFFNKLASEISTKLIGKKILYGKIGVMDNSSVTIKSYVDRNHSIDLKDQPINEFNLYFKVKRDKEDLYPNEKTGTRIWTGLLGVTATYNNGVISSSPTVELYSQTGVDDYDFGSPIKPTTPMLWTTFGGKELWSKATQAKNL